MPKLNQTNTDLVQRIHDKMLGNDKLGKERVGVTVHGFHVIPVSTVM